MRSARGVCARTRATCVFVQLKVSFTSFFPGIGRVTCRQFAACSTIHAPKQGSVACGNHGMPVRARANECGLPMHPCSTIAYACVSHFPRRFLCGMHNRNNCKGDNGLSGFHGNFIIYLFVGNLVQKHMLRFEWTNLRFVVGFVDGLCSTRQPHQFVYLFSHITVIAIDQFDRLRAPYRVEMTELIHN